MSTPVVWAVCLTLLITISLVYLVVAMVNSSRRIDRMLADVAPTTRADDAAGTDS